MITVSNLTKRYGDLTAVDDFSFSVAPGEIVGLIGPNGAGKTSTLRCIVGIQRPVTMHAALAFSLDGKEYRLDAERQDDNSYDLIFKDQTAGKTTYGAGRYLTTEVAEGNDVVIDFNVAYNPPCAFTEFATCPLPLPQNIVPMAIEAGEKIRMNDEG